LFNKLYGLPDIANFRFSDRQTRLINRQAYTIPSTKGLTRNLNLRTHLKLEYNIKSLNYIQKNLRFQAMFLFCWTIVFYLF